MKCWNIIEVHKGQWTNLFDDWAHTSLHLLLLKSSTKALCRIVLEQNFAYNFSFNFSTASVWTTAPSWTATALKTVASLGTTRTVCWGRNFLSSLTPRPYTNATTAVRATYPSVRTEFYSMESLQSFKYVFSNKLLSLVTVRRSISFCFH